MKFLVTGGAGFIGSHLTDFLLKKGHAVRVLDNFRSGKENNLVYAQTQGKDTFELLKGDIRDRSTVEQACEGRDVILHLASLKSVPESFKIPEEYQAVSVEGTKTLLAAAQKKGVKRLVFSSSSAVYGNNEHLPLKETHKPTPLSPYAATKLSAEEQCKDFSQTSGLSTIALRYFNVFGPRQAKDDEYSVVIPKFIDCIKNDKPTPILGDGGQSRDFVYIDDVVTANFLAATTPDIKHEVFNIGSGTSHTILDLTKAINKIFNKNIAPTFFPFREGDIYTSAADISKAQKILGYRSAVTFEDGLRRTIKDS